MKGTTQGRPEAGLDELMDGGPDEAFSPDELDSMRALWDALDEVEAPDDEPVTLNPPPIIGQDLRAVAQARRRLPLVIGILAAFALGSAVSLGLRADSHHTAIEVGAAAFMAAGVLSLMAGVRLGALKRAAGLGLIAAGAATYVFFTMWQLKTEPIDPNVKWYEIACLKAMLMWGIPGAALMVWSLWGARLPTPLTGGLLGIGVGFFSATFLHLHCPLVNPMHLFLHHGGAVALMGLIGAGAAWFLLRKNLADAG